MYEWRHRKGEGGIYFFHGQNIDDVIRSPSLIDDVRGNGILSISKKYTSKFHQMQIDEISNSLYKLFKNIELKNDQNEKR